MAVELFANNWQLKRDGEDLVLREFIFNSESYANKYDEIQKTIHELSGIDDLLAGKLYVRTMCIQPASVYVQALIMHNTTSYMNRIFLS